MKNNTIIDQKEESIREIAWEKWRDPYGSDSQEAEWPGAWGTCSTDEIVQQALEGSLIDRDDYNDEELEDANEELERQQRSRQKQVKVAIMSTPMGIIPITEHTSAGRIFNFWTAHTNFRITQDIIEAIDNTDGIESFDLFTPYRWRIAIGKAFQSVTVKERLMKNLSAKPIQQKV